MEEQVTIQKFRSEGANLNVKELFFKYVRFLPLYVIFVALALIGSFIYLRYAPESYRSYGQIAIRDEKSSGTGRDDKLDVLMQSDGRKNIQMEIEVLQSRPLMSRVVEALNLNFDYAAKGRFKDLNAYRIAPIKIVALRIADSSQSFKVNLTFPSQTEFKVNGSTRVFAFGENFTTPHGDFKLVRETNEKINPEYIITWHPTAVKAGILMPGLAIAPKQNTGILTLSMESTSPVLSADVINRLMEEYKDVTIEDKNASTRKSLDFIDANLKEREKELDSIKQIYVAYQKANNIIDPETQSSNYFGRIEDALRMEQQQRMQLNNAVQIRITYATVRMILK
jgi:uncharacterized protein involved in exopolysaccharide biosynthesis